MIPPAAIQLAVMAIEAFPGLLSAGEKLVTAITTHTQFTPEQKADLLARVGRTTANVAAVEPRDV